MFQALPDDKALDMNGVTFEMSDFTFMDAQCFWKQRKTNLEINNSIHINC